jgi:hypothetical protein
MDPKFEEKLFNLAYAHHNETSMKVGKHVLTPKQVTNTFYRSVQAFLRSPIQKIDKDRSIQAFTTSSDIQVASTDVFNVTTEVTNYDLLWQEAFKSINLRKGELSWEIHTAKNGVTFYEIPEGGKIKYLGMNSSKTTVNVKKYGAGLGVTWETMEGRKVYLFIDQIETARSAYYNKLGEIHYGLLATAGATNTIAYQGATSDSVLDRDIQTINYAYEQISDDNKDSGYGDTVNSRYLLYTAPTLRSRINRALRATSAEVASLGGRGQVVDANVDPRYTWTSQISANKALMVLPKQKIQNSEYLGLTTFEKTDQDSMNKFKAYWTAFGAAIGDNDQVYEVSFA